MYAGDGILRSTLQGLRVTQISFTLAHLKPLDKPCIVDVL